MLTTTIGVVQVPGPDELEQARHRGVVDAAETVERLAPADPLLRVAWATGFGANDQVRAAVAAAREAGATWAEIAEVTGQRDRRYAEMKYGAGAARQQQYRRRRGGDES